jgi:hypothetical protein
LNAAFTAMGHGLLFPLLDPDARLSFTVTSRAMSADEWEQWRRSPACARRRRPGEMVECGTRLTGFLGFPLGEWCRQVEGHEGPC